MNISCTVRNKFCADLGFFPLKVVRAVRCWLEAMWELFESLAERNVSGPTVIKSALRLRGPAPSVAVLILSTCFWLASLSPVGAHWITQKFDLSPGWNAVYLNVDASHASIEALVGSDAANPIEEVWLWQPAPATAQFVTSPQTPTTTGSQWITWNRSTSATATLQRLRGNAAYLVKVAGGSVYTWNLKGKAIAPNYLWTSTGLNFIGFPTPSGAPPTFEAFLGPAPALQQSAEIFNYVGGDLSPNNPARLYAFRTQALRRGEAFWIRSGETFNRYFGPVELTLDGGGGLMFGSNLGQTRFRLRNLTGNPLTITLRRVGSESAPVDQPTVIGAPPLLLRGAINTADLTYSFTELTSTPQTLALSPSGQPGSDAEVVVGLNRSMMTGDAGALYAGLLRLTDSLGLSQVDVPVSAQVASRAGLWVGSASVDNVQHYLKSYLANSDGTLMTTTDGAYLATGTNTSPGAVARPFPLRLIVHNNGTQSTLLQRVFHGLDASTNRVVATQERLLNPALLSSARRISCTHLPWSGSNTGWDFNAPLGTAGSITVTVPLAHNDQSSNPFLHTYHPDHDGLDASGRNPLQRGMESYDVTRVITLSATPPANDFASLTTGSTTLSGDYSEVVTMRGLGGHSRQFRSSGRFALNRLSDITTLTR